MIKKPVITHNGMLDLMFLHDKFYEPLPKTVSEFRQRIHSLFPHIYDTKHLINTRMQLKKDFEPGQGLKEAFSRAMQENYTFDQTVKIHSHFQDYSLVNANKLDEK